MDAFIKINGRILDLQKYNREVYLIKEFLMHKIEEIIRQHGFSKEKEGEYYHLDYDLSLKISIHKKKELEFV
jgi:hypothetical protein